MYRCPICSNSAIPDEYRTVAENLFPPGGFAADGLSSKAAAEFADALGIGDEYQRVLNINKPGGGDMGNFLELFRNNLDLLIQKTWVEKADEVRKEKLQDEVPGFVAGIEQGNFQKAIDEFGVILGELAYLFFGAQSSRDDFTEYAFRIDAQMGLFWWYGSRLHGLKESAKDVILDGEALWAVLLIGICYLTNF
ncbi:MAG TPA: hypothetical protein DEQ14_00790 [Treponema sp.]|nr:hypothetical protein [Treponema sp.]